MRAQRAAGQRWVVRWWELALVGGVATVNAVGSLVADPTTSGIEAPAPWWMTPVLIAPGLSLAVRQHRPVVPVMVTTAVLAVLTFGSWQPGSLPGTLFLTVFLLGSWGTRRQAIVGVLAPLSLMAAAAATGATYFDSVLSLAIPIALLVAWGAGLAARGHRRRDDAARLNASADAVADAIAAERRRIARELHDIVSHTMSVVSVHAGVARHLVATGSDLRSLERSMGIIEEASRTALDDLRTMLGVLREDDTSLTELRPAPGTAEIEQLVGLHRATHGPVSLEIAPPFDRLPDSYRLTTFRIVQEGLTNIAKHAPGSQARVLISVSDATLGVAIHDGGAETAFAVAEGPSARSAATGGVGLAGLRERVAVFGGTLHTQRPVDGRGFSVVIDLPLPTAAVTNEFVR